MKSTSAILTALLLVDRLELAKPDQLHRTAPAYKIFAEAATRSICQALEGKP